MALKYKRKIFIELLIFVNVAIGAINSDKVKVK